MAVGDGKGSTGPSSRSTAPGGVTASTGGYNEAPVLKRLHDGYFVTMQEIATAKRGQPTKGMHVNELSRVIAVQWSLLVGDGLRKRVIAR